MIEQQASRSLSRLDMKQCFVVTTFHNRTPDGWVDWQTRTVEEVLVGVGDGHMRIRYPDRQQKVNRLKTASDDLKSLAALAVAGLLNVGVLADKLEEEFPEHADACRILREYERLRQEKGQ